MQTQRGGVYCGNVLMSAAKVEFVILNSVRVIASRERPVRHGAEQNETDSNARQFKHC